MIEVNELRHIPLFGLLDDEEVAVLASQDGVAQVCSTATELQDLGPGGEAYVMVLGAVHVKTFDGDGQEVLVDSPGHEELFWVRLDARTD